MGLFDQVILPEDFQLPEFPHNPRRFVDSDGEERERTWQTKDLTCGQDLYRLIKTEDVTGEIHQLERRVPPLQKTIESGNWHISDEEESEILWWNIVRPTVDMSIVEICPEDETRYIYTLDIHNGVLQDVELQGKEEVEMFDPSEDQEQ